MKTETNTSTKSNQEVTVYWPEPAGGILLQDVSVSGRWTARTLQYKTCTLATKLSGHFSYIGRNKITKVN